MNPLSTLRFILNHPRNRGNRLAAVKRYLDWQIRSRFQDEITFEWIEGTKLLVRNGMAGATGNIYCGLHESVDMAFVLHVLRQHDLFVDVGANVGSYTVLASGVCGAKSLSIEPDPVAATFLRSNVRANDLKKLVTVAQTAVGNENGHVAFTIGRDTINQVSAHSDLSTQRVPITTLDTLLVGQSPSLIKMDIEGFEDQALLGAKETLRKRSLLAILVETVTKDSVQLLRLAGFQQCSYDPDIRLLLPSDSPSGTNYLFARDIEHLNRRIGVAPIRYFRGSAL